MGKSKCQKENRVSRREPTVLLVAVKIGSCACVRTPESMHGLCTGRPSKMSVGEGIGHDGQSL